MSADALEDQWTLPHFPDVLRGAGSLVAAEPHADDQAIAWAFHLQELGRWNVDVRKAPLSARQLLQREERLRARLAHALDAAPPLLEALGAPAGPAQRNAGAAPLEALRALVEDGSGPLCDAEVAAGAPRLAVAAQRIAQLLLDAWQDHNGAADAAGGAQAWRARTRAQKVPAAAAGKRKRLAPASAAGALAAAAAAAAAAVAAAEAAEGEVDAASRPASSGVARAPAQRKRPRGQGQQPPGGQKLRVAVGYPSQYHLERLRESGVELTFDGSEPPGPLLPPGTAAWEGPSHSPRHGQGEQGQEGVEEEAQGARQRQQQEQQQQQEEHWEQWQMHEGESPQQQEQGAASGPAEDPWGGLTPTLVRLDGSQALGDGSPAPASDACGEGGKVVAAEQLLAHLLGREAAMWHGVQPIAGAAPRRGASSSRGAGGGAAASGDAMMSSELFTGLLRAVAAYTLASAPRAAAMQAAAPPAPGLPALLFAPDAADALLDAWAAHVAAPKLVNSAARVAAVAASGAFARLEAALAGVDAFAYPLHLWAFSRTSTAAAGAAGGALCAKQQYLVLAVVHPVHLVDRAPRGVGTPGASPSPASPPPLPRHPPLMFFFDPLAGGDPDLQARGLPQVAPVVALDNTYQRQEWDKAQPAMGAVEAFMLAHWARVAAGAVRSAGPSEQPPVPCLWAQRLAASAGAALEGRGAPAAARPARPLSVCDALAAAGGAASRTASSLARGIGHRPQLEGVSLGGGCEALAAAAVLLAALAGGGAEDPGCFRTDGDDVAVFEAAYGGCRDAVCAALAAVAAYGAEVAEGEAWDADDEAEAAEGGAGWSEEEAAVAAAAKKEGEEEAAEECAVAAEGGLELRRLPGLPQQEVELRGIALQLGLDLGGGRQRDQSLALGRLLDSGALAKDVKRLGLARRKFKVACVRPALPAPAAVAARDAVDLSSGGEGTAAQPPARRAAARRRGQQPPLPRQQQQQQQQDEEDVIECSLDGGAPFAPPVPRHARPRQLELRPSPNSAAARTAAAGAAAPPVRAAGGGGERDSGSSGGSGGGGAGWAAEGVGWRPPPAKRPRQLFEQAPEELGVRADGQWEQDGQEQRAAARLAPAMTSFQHASPPSPRDAARAAEHARWLSGAERALLPAELRVFQAAVVADVWAVTWLLRQLDLLFRLEGRRLWSPPAWFATPFMWLAPWAEVPEDDDAERREAAARREWRPVALARAWGRAMSVCLDEFEATQSAAPTPRALDDVTRLLRGLARRRAALPDPARGLPAFLEAAEAAGAFAGELRGPPPRAVEAASWCFLPAEEAKAAAAKAAAAKAAAKPAKGAAAAAAAASCDGGGASAGDERAARIAARRAACKAAQSAAQRAGRRARERAAVVVRLELADLEAWPGEAAGGGHTAAPWLALRPWMGAADAGLLRALLVSEAVAGGREGAAVENAARRAKLAWRDSFCASGALQQPPADALAAADAAEAAPRRGLCPLAAMLGGGPPGEAGPLVAAAISPREALALAVLRRCAARALGPLLPAPCPPRDPRPLAHLLPPLSGEDGTLDPVFAAAGLREALAAAQQRQWGLLCGEAADAAVQWAQAQFRGGTSAARRAFAAGDWARLVAAFAAGDRDGAAAVLNAFAAAELRREAAAFGWPREAASLAILAP
ncbi:MAG: hypothetical protein J3K34DRAFT_475830 [Monoraphidium minutum]|nr:MAG: hypothetical protein J3K34DRAFT_475830 [Monoraphidium minutum]